jgi:hypothetical protein
MIKFFFMTSGSIFTGDEVEEEGLVKNVMEVKFIRVADPRNPEESVDMPKNLPIGYPMNSKVYDISLDKIKANSWFANEVSSLAFVKVYQDEVAHWNSPIIQPPPGTRLR